jgi:predicted aspartyl protease
LCTSLVTGPHGTRDVSLLVDTGSNYTVVAMEILEAIGCSPGVSRDRVRITTADGVLIAPRVVIEELMAFGRRMAGAAVIAHDLPFTGPIDGLLGMDVLLTLQARIDIGGASIEIG